tara:strand:- start:746 stop:1111 length:366 start_codon:yes stop_codon:yes gene_type:complete
MRRSLKTKKGHAKSTKKRFSIKSRKSLKKVLRRIRRKGGVRTRKRDYSDYKTPEKHYDDDESTPDTIPYTIPSTASSTASSTPTELYYDSDLDSVQSIRTKGRKGRKIDFDSVPPMPPLTD